MTNAGPRRWLSAAVVVWVLSGGGLFAENPRTIRFEHLSTEDGLPMEAVQAIHQDSDGFMWFGTQGEGLVRYDGYEFTVFRHDPDDPSSLASSWVWSILEDREGRLWVGTDGGGLHRFDATTETFERFMFDEADPNSLSSDRVRTLYEDRDGTLWVGTDDAGLNRLGEDRRTFERIGHGPNDSNSLASDRIRSIVQDAAGSLWVGTDGGGVGQFDAAANHIVRYRHDPTDPSSLGDDRIRVVYQTADGSIWIGTYEAGLDRFDPATGTFQHFRHDPTDSTSLGDDQIRDVVEDSQGTLWVGTDAGMSEWVPELDSFRQHRHAPTRETSLSDDRVIVTYEDRSAVLWVGTFNGLNRFNVTAGSFLHYGPDTTNGGLNHGTVMAFDEDSEGDVWIGTYGGGLNRLNPDTGRFTHYRHDAADPNSLVDDRVMAVHVDDAGIVWVGTYSDGLDRFDPVTETVTHFRHDPQDSRSLSWNGVTLVFEDRTGDLWVGTYRGGLNRLDREDGTFTKFRHDPDVTGSLSSDSVLALHEDKSGVLWVGTDGGGLNRFDRGSGQFEHYRHDPEDGSSLSSDSAWSIHEDRSGGFWIGTQASGLNYWPADARRAHRNSFRRYATSDGLPSSVVYGVSQDGLGRLWISTSRGLSRLDPAVNVFKNYTLKHGLQDLDFNFGAQLRTRDNTIYFGGSNGFNSFAPDQIVDSSNEPPVVLTGVLKFNERFPLSVPVSKLSELEIGHDDSVITFEFAALDYTESAANRYQYRLEGFDEQWTNSGTTRRATYTNLDPGEYTFRVRAANSDGVWNESGIALHLTARPPWWRTTLAYAMYMFLTIMLGLTFEFRHRKNLAIETGYARRLEREVETRTQELAQRNTELASLNKRLESASYTDALTGLMNRRFLSDQIDTDVAAVARSYTEDAASSSGDPHRDLLFMMLDLDGLKGINDTYGHAAGDAVLVQVREILSRVCRKSDTLVRWGGDEFLLVGRQTDRIMAEYMAERLRSAVTEHVFDLGGGHTARLSCSIGFSMYPFIKSEPTLFNWEQVVHMADRGLYLSKQSGRNRWTGVLAGSSADPATLALRIDDDLETLRAERIVTLRGRVLEGDESPESDTIESGDQRLVEAGAI